MEGIRYALLQRAYHQMISGRVKIFNRLLSVRGPGLEDPHYAVIEVAVGQTGS